MQDIIRCRIDKELKEKFTQVCSDNFQNPSDVLRMCIIEYIKQRGQSQPIITLQNTTQEVQTTSTQD